MLTCGRCGTDNPTGFRFCGACGGSLDAAACPTCGSAVPAGQRFCGTCGNAVDREPVARVDQPIPSGPGDGTPPSEERKLATVLFADVVGFTTLAEDRDPEAVAETVARAFARLAGIVDEHGGTVDKYMGDCLMAVFGVPVSHGDDAERAVAAALAMRDVNSDLRFSIGVNSGEVMATVMPGEGRLTVIGDTVNVASRLEKAAGASEVLVGALTAQLSAERVVYREREPMALKGKRDLVPVLEAVALRVRDDTPQLSVTRPPLVGRDAELDFLVSRWRRVVRDRKAEPVILIGDVGIGKSRLLDELAEVAGCDGRLVRTTYPSYGGPGGTRMAAEMVRQLGTVGDEAIDSRLSSLIGDDTSSGLLALDAAAFQQEQLWAFRRLIESRAAERPLLVILDEVQRAAERTLEFLVELLARVDAPVLLVLAGRPDPVDWLLRFPTTTTLRLTPLGPADAAALASALVPEGMLSAAAASSLAARAAGNPLHVRELVRLARDRQGLVPSPNGLGLASNLTLPPSLHAVLAARLDALPAAEKSALQHVALLGEEADDDAVERLGLANAGEPLHRLVTIGLLRQRDGGSYEIVDPLLRDVAYESLPRAVRGSLHRRAASTSSSDYDRARHLDAALRFLPDDDALRVATAAASSAAGHRMVATHRIPDALALLGRAVELGDREPSTMLQLATLYADLARDTDALRVLDLLPPNDDPTISAERVHIRGSALLRTNPAEAVGFFEEARRRWIDAGNAEKEAWAMANAAVALMYLGRMDEASRLMHGALEKFEAMGHRQGVDSAHQMLGIIHPDDPRVEMWLSDGLRLAEEAGDRGRQRNALLNLGFYHYIRARLGGPGDIDTALDYSQRLERIATEMSDVPSTTQGMVCTAMLARDGGLLEEAVACMARAPALTIGPSSGFAVLRDAGVLVADLLAEPATPVPRLPIAGDAMALLGGVIAANALALAGRTSDAAAIVAEMGDELALPTVMLVMGGVTSALTHVLAGKSADSTSALVAVIAAAESMDAGPTAAAARALLAECLFRAGDAEGARQMLGSIRVPLPGGVAGAIVERARAVLGDAEARVRLEAAATALRAPGLLDNL